VPLREQYVGSIPGVGRGRKDEVFVVIHEDCPLHKIVRKPTGDVLGDQ
jgi:hypothetical protein